MSIAALWREVQARRLEEMVKEGVWFVRVGRSYCGFGSGWSHMTKEPGLALNKAPS